MLTPLCGTCSPRTTKCLCILVVCLAIAGPAWCQFPGPGTFTTSADFALGESSGVTATPPDQLQLSSASVTEPYLWVANNTLGKVTKIDTRTGGIVAQYYSTAPTSRLLPDNVADQFGLPPQGSSAHSPSRTSVDLDGNVFVANRAHVDGTWNQQTLTKIAGSRAFAKDFNGNGIIDTSTAEGVLLPDDECVLWTVKVGRRGQIARGVAVDAQNNVWVGTYNDGRLHKFNGQTGELMMMIDTRAETGIGDICCYGLAISKDQKLHMVGIDNRTAVLVDPSAPEGSRVRFVRTPYITYGVAVDGDGRTIAGRWSSVGGSEKASLQVIDWSKPVSNVSIFWGADNGRTRGVAVDGDGFIWTSNYDSAKLLKFAPTGELLQQYPVYGGPIGVAVDSQNNIWTVSESGWATRTDRVTGQRDDYPTGGPAYSYSDMTGFQLRNFTTRQGHWSVTIDGGGYGAVWSNVGWHASVPIGTSLLVDVRASEKVETLEGEAWQSVAGPLIGLTGRYLQVRATMRMPVGAVSPVLEDLTVAAPVIPPVVQISTIAQAKSAPEGTVLRLAPKTITQVYGGDTYIEEKDRNAGIALNLVAPSPVGNDISVIATAMTINGERKLVDGVVEQAAASASPIRPVRMAVRSMGGQMFGYQPATTGGAGLNTVGLYVAAMGRIRVASSGAITLDDGSVSANGLGVPGVRLIGATSGPGSLVYVTGCVTVVKDGADLWPALKVEKLAPYEYLHDFQTPVGSEWSTAARATSPSGRMFLGQFGGTQEIRLSLGNLPPHSALRVSFDLFMIQSIDGNGQSERWILTYDGAPNPVLDTNFSCYPGTTQSYPQPYGQGSNARYTGADEVGTLGYMFSSENMNSVYSFTGDKAFEFPHTGSSLVLKFIGNNYQDVSDESWGIDNLKVEAL